MMLALIALSFSGMVLGAFGVGQCITGMTGGVMGVQALTAGSGCYAYTVAGTRYFGGGYSKKNCQALPHETENGLICCDTDKCNAPKECVAGMTGSVMGVQALTAGSGCYAYTVAGTRYFGGGYSKKNCQALPHETENGLICCDTDKCNAPKECVAGMTGSVMGVQALTAGSGCYAYTVEGTPQICCFAVSEQLRWWLLH
ncbi:unnamed protein product [Polarella glacialis]|uniref:Uncharacterized protein n=1 Tax=Polarella glacialis TaxID=89957 RepID=A0A813ITU7_POLGL|nr:unnamed protein product [Polarella glacialis]